MSHNIHFCRITADTGEEACNSIEAYISDWGNENNWRTIIGAVSKSGKIYVNEDKENELRGYNSWEKIQETIQGQIDNEPEWQKKAFIQCGISIKSSVPVDCDWYAAKMYCDYMYNSAKYRKDKFDVSKDEYYENQYDEYGLTDIDTDEDGGNWIVIFDMHS